MRSRTPVPAVAFVGALLFFAVAASPIISLVSPVHAQSGAPGFDSSADYTRSIDENKGPYDTSGGGTPSQGDRVLIGEPVTATGAGVTYTLDNAGASDFGIDYFTGQLMVGNPLNYEEHTSHTVTVIATNDSGTARQSVTINVNNLDEPEKVTLMWKPSGSDVEFEAKLSDGDVIIGTPAWQWSESDSENGAYTDITSATSATYTNSPDHEYLKATATYTDSHGSGKTASATVRVERPSNFPTGYELKFGVNTSGGYACPHDRTGTNYNNQGADICRSISRNATPEDRIYYPASVKYTHATENDRYPSQGSINYSLSGDDAAKFEIDPTNGDLFPKGTHQYNSPGPDEVFLVTLTATHPSGGDDGTDSVDIALKPSGSNNNPVIQGPQDIRYPENGTWQVAKYTAEFSHPDQTAGWIIGVEPGGGDGDFFDITDDGVLYFKQRPDYENGQGEFNFSLHAYATNGPRGTTYYSVTVIVYNVDEDLEIRGPTVIKFPENSTDPVHTYTAEGTEGSVTWMLEGQDKQWFSLSSSGTLSFRNTPDYEAPFDSSDPADDRNDYLLSITVMDDSGTTDTADDDSSKIEPVRVMVTNVNEPPEFDEGSSATRSVSENAVAGEDIGDPVEATDPDQNDYLEYSLTGDDDDASFDIDYDGQIKTIENFDYGSKTSYTVTITVTDGGGLTDEITVTINSTEVNDPPVFDDAALTTTLSLPENTGSNTNVGSPITATDEDNPTLTYTLEGTTTDKDSFTIDNSGQIKTKTGVTYNYEKPGDADTNNDYQVTVKASDGNSSDTIDVTITVTDINETPAFDEKTPATRSIPENTPADTDIGAAISATDPDNDNGRSGDTLTYTLGGTDVASFDLDTDTGQIKTKAALDKETKPSYSLTVSVRDGRDANGDSDSAEDDTITVTIKVTGETATINSVEVNDPPVFSDATTTREVPENSPPGTNIGPAITATDEENDTLTYTLEGDDGASFDVGSNGQIKTKSGVDYNYEDPGDHDSNRKYEVTVKADDNNGGTDTIGVTITVNDVNETPAFDEGSPATRSIPENTPANTAIGTAISATDPDNENGHSSDTLTYTLGGTDVASFDLDTDTGQIKTKAALDKETQSSYSVTVSVRDGRDANGDSDTAEDATITVNITVTGENEPPVFDDAVLTTTLSLPENTGSNTNVGSPITATDEDNPSLTYTLGGTDASSFQIVSTSGQIRTESGVTYDYEGSQSSYSVTVKADDKNGGTDTIGVTITLTNVDEDGAITFDPAQPKAGTALTATLTDPDGAISNDTWEWFLEGSTSAISGQTSGSYTPATTDVGKSLKVKVSYTDPEGSGKSAEATTSAVIAANMPPTFPGGANRTPKTLSVAENSLAGTTVGTVVAIDSDTGDTLTYSLGGTTTEKDSFNAAFSLNTSTGKITVKANDSLDHETTDTYTFEISVSDGKDAAGLSDGSIDATVDVTINVTDVNETPTFNENSPATRSIPENTGAGQPVGAPFTATDPDVGATLTYLLGGTDKSSFTIDSNGQIKTKTGVTYNHEVKETYSVTVSVHDGKDKLGNASTVADATLAVTITVTDVNETPTFDDNSPATRLVKENTHPADIGAPISATDPDNENGHSGDTLTYTLSGTDKDSFGFNTTTGQIKTKAALDKETKSSYSVTVTVTDGRADDGTAENPTVADDTITVTITVTDENDAPTFTDGSTGATRSIPENTSAGQNIGAPVGATDVDNNTLTYTLEGIDKSHFNIVSTSGQLQTKEPLDYEHKSTYDVTVRVDDNNGNSPTIGVTINVTDVNDAPAFDDGATITRNLPEQTGDGTAFGDAITASDDDPGDTLTYTLGGADASSFGFDSSTKKLKTKAGVTYNYESAKKTYTVTISVRDSKDADGNADTATDDTITVTINLTNVDEDGTVTFDHPQPEARSELTATLADPDVVSGTPNWQWSKSDTMNGTFSNINGATSATYTPADTEVNKYLKATATYRDQHGGPNVPRTASAVAYNPVQAFHNPNEPPTFDEADDPPVFTIEENTPPGEDIGTVTATDPNDEAVAYFLDNTSARVFAIGLISGVIQTKGSLDYEKKNTYAVTVIAKDPQMLHGMMTITINITDAEDPGAINFSSTQPRVESAFTATLNDQDAGRANERWRWALSDTTARAGAYTDITNATSATYTPVAGDEEKYLRVTVTYDDNFVTGETISAISEKAVGSPLPPPPISSPPEFTSTGAEIREIAENTAAGKEIGPPVGASTSNHPLTYTLGGADGSMFDIDRTDGQLMTKEPLDYEAEDQYSVIVIATDQLNAESSKNVTINVTDVDDPGTVSFSSTQARVQSALTATLNDQDADRADEGWQWALSDTTDPAGAYTAITNATSATYTPVTGNQGKYLKATVTYDDKFVTNKSVYEMTGPVMEPEVGPSLKSLSVHYSAADYSVTEGERTTITVGLSAAADRSVLVPVRVTEGTAEPEDYSVSATSVTFGTGDTSSTFTVTANQDTDTVDETVSLGFGTLPAGVLADSPSTATLTITDDDPPAVQQQQPPPPQQRRSRRRSGGGYSYTPSTENQAPIFMEGATATRSVRENSLLGTIIFPPVLAVDPNQDTLTYTVADTDLAHFGINSRTAELTTGAVFDYESGDSYTVTVFVTDGRGGRDSIVVLTSVTDVGEIGYDPATTAIAPITVEDGGSVTTPDGSGSVVFPAATRSVPYYARIGQGSSDCGRDAPEGDLHVYTTVDILDMDGNLLEDLTLEQPVTILLRVNAADLGGLERALEIHEYGGFKAYTRTDSGEDWTEVDFTLFSSDTGTITAFIPGIRDFSCFVVVVDASVLTPPAIQVIAAPGPPSTPAAEPPPQAAPIAPTPVPSAPVVKQGPPIYPPVAQQPEEADDPFGPEATLFTFRAIVDVAREKPLWLLIVLAIAVGAWAALLRAYVAWRRNHPPQPKDRNNKPQLGRDLLTPSG